MPRCKVAPTAYRTPKKLATKRVNQEKDDESSPEKRECPFSPGTKAAEEFSKMTVTSPNLRPRRTSASPARLKSPGRPPARNLYKNLEADGQRSPSRGRGRPRKNPIPEAVFKILPETDSNLEMECDENEENQPPEVISKPRKSVGRPRKQLFVEKMEVDDPKEKLPAISSHSVLKIQPIFLKRVDLKTYRISNTPRQVSKPKSRLASSNPVLFDSDYEESSTSSSSESESDSSISRSPSPIQSRRNKSNQRESKEDKSRKIKAAPKSLEDLRRHLHTSEIPVKMPCRAEEFEVIKRFIVEGVKPGSHSQAMYLSGVPGTGKTATTQSVIKEVAKKYSFDYVAVNAMELMEPINLFSEIYRSLIDAKRISPQNARKKLNGIFAKVDKKRLPVVVLIDELDMLCTKKQDIFYDVFNWTSCEEARVTVISIANTLDLPERVMSQRITSRLGTNRVVFQPYTYPQIEEIVRARLSHAPHLVNELAIEFVAKKVANVSGDLRKAMDLFRRGIEIAVERGEKNQLCFEHVNLAQKESASAARNILGENLSLHGFILFRAGLCQVQSSGVEEFQFHELYKQYRVLCTNLEGINPLHDQAVRRILMELTSNRMLVASPVVNFMRQKIRMGMPTHEALGVIRHVEDARKEGRIE